MEILFFKVGSYLSHSTSILRTFFIDFIAFARVLKVSSIFSGLFGSYIWNHFNLFYFSPENFKTVVSDLLRNCDFRVSFMRLISRLRDDEYRDIEKYLTYYLEEPSFGFVGEGFQDYQSLGLDLMSFLTWFSWDLI